MSRLNLGDSIFGSGTGLDELYDIEAEDTGMLIDTETNVEIEHSNISDKLTPEQDKALMFMKNRIREKINLIKDKMSDMKYRLYMVKIDSAKTIDEVRAISEIQSQLDFIEYLKKIDTQIKSLDTNVDDIEQTNLKDSAITRFSIIEPSSNKKNIKPSVDTIDLLNDLNDEELFNTMLNIGDKQEEVGETLGYYTDEEDEEDDTDQEFEDFDDEDDPLGEFDDSEDSEDDTDQEFEDFDTDNDYDDSMFEDDDEEESDDQEFEDFDDDSMFEDDEEDDDDSDDQEFSDFDDDNDYDDSMFEDDDGENDDTYQEFDDFDSDTEYDDSMFEDSEEDDDSEFGDFDDTESEYDEQYEDDDEDEFSTDTDEFDPDNMFEDDDEESDLEELDDSEFEDFDDDSDSDDMFEDSDDDEDDPTEISGSDFEDFDDSDNTFINRNVQRQQNSNSSAVRRPHNVNRGNVFKNGSERGEKTQKTFDSITKLFGGASKAVKKAGHKISKTSKNSFFDLDSEDSKD